MDDELLLAVKKNGGVAQMVAFSSYIKPDSKERTAALTKMRDDLGLGFGPGRRRAGGPAGPPPQRACPVEDPKTAAGQARRGGIGRFLDMLPPEKRAAIQKRMAEIDAQYPAAPRATVKDFVNHIDYAVKLIGIDHVGISSDFDGGGGIDGWNSAAEAVNVTLELVRRGYTEQQIGKLWGGNLLRVWSDVEKVSRQLQKQK
jgi:membrane dipeptidase